MAKHEVKKQVNYTLSKHNSEERIIRNMKMRSCSHLVTVAHNAQLVQTHLVGVINLEPKLPIIS